MVWILVIPDLLSREVDTIEGYSHLLVKRELAETKMELQDAKGKLSQASKRDWIVSQATLETRSWRYLTSTSAAIMILLVQRKLANLADIPSALSLPSEEQYYSKCTSLVPRPLVCVF